MLLVTDCAGFIGSHVVADLSDPGRSDVVICYTLLDRGATMQTRFIYVSSAATCRDREEGFVNDCALWARKTLRPINEQAFV
jgi:hypothetical protein